MIYNATIRQLFRHYHYSIIMEFIKELPLPDIREYRHYRITTEDGQKMVVWGKNSKEVVRQFNEFLELLIFH